MSKKMTYSVPVKFVFEGNFVVEADSASEAREIVERDCHLVMWQSIECNAEEVEDWEFDTHSEKTIGRVTRNIYRV